MPRSPDLAIFVQTNRQTGSKLIPLPLLHACGVKKVTEYEIAITKALYKTVQLLSNKKMKTVWIGHITSVKACMNLNALMVLSINTSQPAHVMLLYYLQNFNWDT